MCHVSGDVALCPVLVFLVLLSPGAPCCGGDGDGEGGGGASVIGPPEWSVAALGRSVPPSAASRDLCTEIGSAAPVPVPPPPPAPRRNRAPVTPTAGTETAGRQRSAVTLKWTVTESETVTVTVTVITEAVTGRV